MFYHSISIFCIYCYGDHRDLHLLTHSFPTRRSSDLKCRDWRRRQRVRQLFIFSAATSDDEIEQVPDDAPSAHASAASKMELEKLSTAIAALPSSLREVLLLRTVDGLNQSEAALRSEERRVGKECVRTCSSRGSQYH